MGAIRKGIEEEDASRTISDDVIVAATPEFVSRRFE